MGDGNGSGVLPGSGPRGPIESGVGGRFSISIKGFGIARTGTSSSMGCGSSKPKAGAMVGYKI